jgi:hypothetical protein
MGISDCGTSMKKDADNGGRYRAARGHARRQVFEVRAIR